GRLPVLPADDQPARALVNRVGQANPGLAGYVGVDMILVDGDPQRPVIVEINPRLTTSYLGYARLYGPAFAARLLAASGFCSGTTGRSHPSSPLTPIAANDSPWPDAPIAYTAAGEIVRESRSGD